MNERAAEPETPARNLAHVFVHRNNNEHATPGDETPHLPETPLAYASDEEPHCSPTPAYPRDGARAGAAVEGARQPHGPRSDSIAEIRSAKTEQLEQDNADLKAALSAAQEEIAALKQSTVRQLRSRLTKRPSNELANGSDPFAPAKTNGFMSLEDRTQQENNGQLSLEGTLESIRVQTEQLLEINDDFLAEQRRWSSRLSVRRSNYNSPYGGLRRSSRSSPMGHRSSPLRAAS